MVAEMLYLLMFKLMCLDVFWELETLSAIL